jgi:hypothetical protein
MDVSAISTITRELMEEFQNLLDFLNLEYKNSKDFWLECPIIPFLAQHVEVPSRLGVFMIRAALDPSHREPDLFKETFTVCEAGLFELSIEVQKLQSKFPTKIGVCQGVSSAIMTLFGWLSELPKNYAERPARINAFLNKLGQNGSNSEVSKWLKEFERLDQKFRPLYEVRFLQMKWWEKIDEFQKSPFYQNQESAFRREKHESAFDFETRVITELSGQWRVITTEHLQEDFRQKKCEYSEKFRKEHESEFQIAEAEVADFREKHSEELVEVEPLVIPSLDPERQKIVDLENWIKTNREENRIRRIAIEVELRGDVEDRLRTNPETKAVCKEIEELERRLQHDQKEIETDQEKYDKDVCRIQELRAEIERKKQNYSEIIERNNKRMKQLAESGAALVRHFAALGALTSLAVGYHDIPRDGVGVRRFCENVLTTLPREIKKN